MTKKSTNASQKSTGFQNKNRDPQRYELKWKPGRAKTEEGDKKITTLKWNKKLLPVRARKLPGVGKKHQERRNLHATRMTTLTPRKMNAGLGWIES
jgi:hypothetical protein